MMRSSLMKFRIMKEISDITCVILILIANIICKVIKIQCKLLWQIKSTNLPTLNLECDPHIMMA
jgi:hypothetical protein